MNNVIYLQEWKNKKERKKSTEHKCKSHNNAWCFPCLWNSLVQKTYENKDNK